MEYKSSRNVKTKYNKLMETYPQFHFLKNVNHGLNNVTMNKDVRGEEVAYMCEECYGIMYAKRWTYMNSTIMPYTKEYVKLEPVFKETLFAANCPFCSQYDVKMIELDYNIAYPIHILNSKGFRTSFSCEGHLKDSDCFPYILFEGLEILEYVDTLGDSWFLDVKSLRDYPGRVAIRSNWVEHYDDKLEYMIELLEWVKSLPSIK